MKPLLDYLEKTDFSKRIKEALYTDKPIDIHGATDDAHSVLIKLIERLTNRPILVVHKNLYHAQKLYDAMQHLDAKTLFYPQDEFITTEMLAMSEALKLERLHTMHALLEDTNRIVITHPTGFIRETMPKKRYHEARNMLKKGDIIDLETFVRRLSDYGYKGVRNVENVGEFAQRGSIIDCFSPVENYPVRIDFFDNEIDSLRQFDVNTQRSSAQLEHYTIMPRVEFFYDDEGFNQLENTLQKTLKSHTQATIERVRLELETLKERNDQDRLSRYLPLLERPETIADYMHAPVCIIIDQPALESAVDSIREDLDGWFEQHGDYASLGFTFLKEPNHIHVEHTIALNAFELEHKRHIKIPFRGKEAPVYADHMQALFKDLRKFDKRSTVLITFESRERRQQFIDACEDVVDVKILGAYDSIFDKRINLLISNNPTSFEWFDANLLLLRDKDFRRDSSKPKTAYKSVFKDARKLTHVKQLAKGDTVVHYDHGIGRYVGIETMDVAGAMNDYIVIQYRGDDTLYIPVENIHLIQKYEAPEGIVPKLNRLGGPEWAKTKRKVRKKAKDIAQDLINLYAAREKAQGFAYSEDQDLMHVFEADFPFEETPDQQAAINEVKKDMESSRPMDRLILGDVGYGKTEIALRAAAKAALDNKQTAYLAPTTVLSRQHFYTFKTRLARHGITCVLLNRFVTPSQQKKALKRIQSGEADVILGTHRLLSKDINFKDLGLLIIDEEQRFGVEHKEKIKAMKHEIDVLSLSATPIPRTLQMAMSGVKAMSVLDTPPRNRLPVQTYVLERNEHVVKDAVERELARNGQVFYLYNRVETIENIHAHLSRLVPDARIAYAHGKMRRLELERIITAFLDHEYDMLVSTTIIETGIDIPNANTLIIHDADMLGLAQLYQLRGRVGRSDRIAYAYLMYQKNKRLTEEARKRLNVIKSFTELGSGHKIALRDLAIRGAGDVLGTEQSGFIDAVGIDLFMEILKDEIDKQQSLETIDPLEEEKQREKIRVNVDKSIPESYIPDDDTRIDLHRKIRDLDSSNAMLLLMDELKDRFGNPPQSLMLYMAEKVYENLAVTHGVERTFKRKTVSGFTFSKDASKSVNGERLFSRANELSPHIRLSYRNEKIAVEMDTYKLEKPMLYYAVDLLETI